MHGTRLILLVITCLAVLAPLTGSASAGKPVAQTLPGDPLDPRTYAPESRPFLTVFATGVQRYACQANGSWQFTDPVAGLYDGARTTKRIGRHYLNVSTGRPVWELEDGSSVEAARKASAPNGTGNVAELLLQAVVTGAGDGDRLEKSTWVQRLNTVGGVAPAAACSPGSTLDVPYSTDYVFWTTSASAEDERRS